MERCLFHSGACTETAFFSTWISEEKAISVRFGPEDFWCPQREPREGIWPPLRDPSRPLIDPEETKLADLPEPTIGKAAINLWRTRRDTLVAETAAIKTERESSGFGAMLRRALGHPTPGNPLQHDLTTIRKDLTSPNPVTATAATDKVVHDLHLTIENFNRVMKMKELAGPGSDRSPSDTEWAELYTLLATAHKVKHFYPKWVVEENTAGLSAEYWRALKAQLPRARVTGEERQQWLQGLAVRSRPAIIDPDLVDKAAFNGSGAEPAFTLWQARHDWVANTITGIDAKPKTLAGLDSIIEDKLSVTVADLLSLEEGRKAGESIQARLDQLSLTNAAFLCLLKIRELLLAGQPVLGEEWANVHSILVQVAKRRLSAEWRDEERLAGITLSPDFFISPEVSPAQPLAPAMRWRLNLDDRFQWLDTLQSRVDQERSVLTSLHDVVSHVEESVLPALRDALVMATGTGADLLAKAAWVTNRLLIDAKAGGCQQTTRISQAIETVQVLIFSAWTSQSPELQALGISLDAHDFDEEWRWIGSYSTWRSAMFVFMYPENVAVANLRRRQTPAFRKLAKAIRDTRRLTREQAYMLAAEYAAYYEDVAKLVIGATAQAIVTERGGTQCVPTITKKPLIFIFGRGGITNQLYWSTFNPADKSGYAQSFWDYVPGAPIITSVSGVALYERSTTERRIFLFIRTTEYKLQFLTYDLEASRWSGPTDLGVPPGDIRSMDIVVGQNYFFFVPPELAIRSGSDIYYRALNPEGTGWNDGDWKKNELYHTKFNPSRVSRLFAMINREVFVKRDRWIVTDNATSLRPLTADGEFIGAIYWGKAKNSEQDKLILKLTNGTIFEYEGGDLLAEQFPLEGLKVIAPNSGRLDFASYAYERRNAPILLGRAKGVTPQMGKANAVEQDGIYLRLVELQEKLSNEPIRSTTYRIAPRVFSSAYAAGQFLIPARLEGNAVNVRRNTVKFVLYFSNDSATNRAYAEEAYFFVPMMLCDGLRRAGEYVAALDCARTVLDYEQPTGKQKIYYGLVQEESLPEVYKRTADWLLDPLDPHAIAASRRLTYTRFTLLTIVRLLLDFADDEFTRDTSESVPRARALYLTALTVLNFPELHQQLGECNDVIGELNIELGPEAPAKAAVNIKKIAEQLSQFKNAATLKTLVPELKQALAANMDWDRRIARARTLVEEAASTESPSPTIARILENSVTANKLAYSNVLVSPVISRAAEDTGRVVAAHFLSSVASTAGVAPTALETGKIDLPWLRRNVPDAAANNIDFVLSPNLQPIPPNESPSLTGLFRPRPAAGMLGSDAVIHIPAAPAPAPVPPPNPIKPAVVPSLAFCIPSNPILAALRLHAELNLHKIRTCRNIAGMKRELDPYATSTDTVTGLPTIGAGGQLALPGATVLRPTLYRFAALLQRAKELVQIAQQVESAMLSAIEKRDAEAYSMLKAKQDLELAQAGVQLEVLRLKRASDGVTLATLQQARAQIQLNHYQKLLDEDLLGLERQALDLMSDVASGLKWAGTINKVAAVASLAAATSSVVGAAMTIGAGIQAAFSAGAAAGTVKSLESGFMGSVQNAGSFFSALTPADSAKAQWNLTRASFDRRRQEWELSRDLAEQDWEIGAQQVTIAKDGVEIAKQEKEISEMRNTHAKDTISFLANKFTNVELYDWMSDVLERVFSFFLQQATSTARLAENQLAFERQEPPTVFIQSDYWQAPSDSLLNDNLQGAPIDRRGLTGSARLLQDLYRLDQYSFDTNQRKLQLSKTISLALTAPTEFQRFCETGVLTFATPMEMFDRDFPGHYLRLIKSVRTSVIALIPPTHGIRATLSSAGLSRVVIGPDVFQTIPIRRDPELVALSSPMNASGVFELDAQSSGMLLPFEGSGVDTVWELRMPKAANLFDYRTIGDVLITIDYTAFQNLDYSQQIIQSLQQMANGDRLFSFRNQFADQWYDFHNPDLTLTPMTVRFKTFREDFPPNIDTVQSSRYFSISCGLTLNYSKYRLPICVIRRRERPGLWAEALRPSMASSALAAATLEAGPQ